MMWDRHRTFNTDGSLCEFCPYLFFTNMPLLINIKLCKSGLGLFLISPAPFPTDKLLTTHIRGMIVKLMSATPKGQKEPNKPPVWVAPIDDRISGRRSSSWVVWCYPGTETIFYVLRARKFQFVKYTNNKDSVITVEPWKSYSV